MRVALLHGGRGTKKKRTTTKRNTTHPSWNEALVFNVQGKDSLVGAKVELTVFNDNLLGTNKVMGRFVVGDQAAGDDLARWLQSSSGARNAPGRWHPLLAPTDT